LPRVACIVVQHNQAVVDDPLVAEASPPFRGCVVERQLARAESGGLVTDFGVGLAAVRDAHPLQPFAHRTPEFHFAVARP
jgi:hypothetical protein